MNELQTILEESVTRLFSERVDRQFLASAEEQAWSPELWRLAEDQGLTRVLLGEDNGGMGAGWTEAFAVVRACGRHAVPLPIPEQSVALWLCERAGLAIPEGFVGLLPQVLVAGASGTFSDAVARVPWGREANAFVGVTNEGQLVVFDTANVRITEEQNLAREPRDTVTLVEAKPVAAGALDLKIDCVRWLGALLRAAQIAGAAAACLEMSVRYTSDREQFGRALSQFQAIQHHLAELAGAMTSIDTMARTAFQAVDARGLAAGAGRDAGFEIAAAKCRASEAVEMLTRLAHQVHGAIGFTYEYDLQFLTRRLWSWRAEFGASGEWGEQLGRAAAYLGGDRLWGLVAS